MSARIPMATRLVEGPVPWRGPALGEVGRARPGTPVENRDAVAGPIVIGQPLDRLAPGVAATGRAVPGGRGRGAATLADRAAVAAAILLFIAACLLVVWCQQRCIRLGYRIEQERGTRSVLVDEKRRLEAEYAALRVPARIEKIAREDLGMRLPSPNEIVTLVGGAPAAPAGRQGATP